MNASVVGKVYPETTFVVEPRRVESFRSVFGETHGVPATFVTAAEFAVMPTIVGDPELALDFTRVLHGGEEYSFRRALVESETLLVRSRIDSIRTLRAGSVMTIVTELVDADGDVACTARSTLIERAEG